LLSIHPDGAARGFRLKARAPDNPSVAGQPTTGEESGTDARLAEPPGAERGAWAGLGWAVALIAVIVTAVIVWIMHLDGSTPQAPLVAAAGPQEAGPSTSTGTSTGTAAGGSAPSSSPLSRVDQAWAAKAAAATGISDRAFLAYASADLTIEKEQPACGLGWNTLAAIGTVESANGTYGGATVLADGYTSKPIVGVPLDGGTFGGGRVAAIPAAGHGKQGGGTTWVHAVGPFQFLPSTWAQWGTDGNGDGVASPNQIDDAALSAARYLCASGPMTTAAGWRAAVLTYNHSDAYANEVADLANQYAAQTSGLS
jgi:membrane-bound lytic murein transglycosylase B